MASVPPPNGSSPIWSLPLGKSRSPVTVFIYGVVQRLIMETELRSQIFGYVLNADPAVNCYMRDVPLQNDGGSHGQPAFSSSNSTKSLVEGVACSRHKGDKELARILLTSGILDPLRELKNVRSWCINLTVEDEFEKPPLAHRRMVLDLSAAVEKIK